MRLYTKKNALLQTTYIVLALMIFLLSLPFWLTSLDRRKSTDDLPKVTNMVQTDTEARKVDSSNHQITSEIQTTSYTTKQATTKLTIPPAELIGSYKDTDGTRTDFLKVKQETSVEINTKHPKTAEENVPDKMNLGSSSTSDNKVISRNMTRDESTVEKDKEEILQEDALRDDPTLIKHSKSSKNTSNKNKNSVNIDQLKEKEMVKVKNKDQPTEANLYENKNKWLPISKDDPPTDKEMDQSSTKAIISTEHDRENNSDIKAQLKDEHKDMRASPKQTGHAGKSLGTKKEEVSGIEPPILTTGSSNSAGSNANNGKRKLGVVKQSPWYVQENVSTELPKNMDTRTGSGNLADLKSRSMLSQKVSGHQNVHPVTIPEPAELQKMDRDELEELYHLYVENLQTHCVRQRHIGNMEYGGYHICEDVLGQHSCLMYSFGYKSRNDRSFDEDILKQYGCDVHVFDPQSMKPQNDKQSSPKVTMHSIGLGAADDPKHRTLTLASIRSTLNHLHRKIDILKLDIESREWESLAQIASGQDLDTVELLIVEFHVCMKNCTDKDQRTKERYVRYLSLFRQLYEIGFRIYYFRMWPSSSYKVSGITRIACHDVHMMKPS